MVMHSGMFTAIHVGWQLKLSPACIVAIAAGQRVQYRRKL